MLVRGRGGRGCRAAFVVVVLVATACGGTPDGAVEPSGRSPGVTPDGGTEEVDVVAGVTFEAADDPTAVPPVVTSETPAAPTEAVEPEATDGDAASASDGTEAADTAEPTDGAEPTDSTRPADDGEPSAEPVIEDGRHPVFLVALDVAARSVTFDVIQFLTGDAAKAAYEEDVPEDPDVGPPNDYWIRNVSPRLRTLPLASDVTVTVVRLGEPSGADAVPWTLDELPDHLASQSGADDRLGWNPYWLTVEDGVVVAIDEQYLP
jgi:hypothetical protein